METTYDLVLRHISVVSTITVLIIVLKQYKVHVILIERINQMWQDYCIKHGIQYKPVGNGKKEL